MERLRICQRTVYVLFILLMGTSVFAFADDKMAMTPYDAQLSQYPYPYPVQFYQFEAQQQALTMAYMDVKPKGKAKGVVMLLHGKNFSGAYWQKTIAALVKEKYRVLVPDQIGFGKSSKPTRFQYSFAALAYYTKELLDKLGIRRVSVVGHSMGGMVASRFTLMYSDSVERMILVNPIGLEDWQRDVPYAALDDLIKAEQAKTPAGIKHYMTESYFAGQWKAEYQPLLAIQAGWRLGPDAAQMAKVGALTSEMVFTQPVIYNFPDITVPSLLIIGTRDRTAIGKNRLSADKAKQLGQYQNLGKRAAKMLPNAKLVEIEGVGHLPQVEAFDTYINALTGFLNQS